MLKLLLITDLAPVTSAVTDGEKNRLVLRFCLTESLFAPRVPVDGIMGML
jgi:hypothetical protein